MPVLVVLAAGIGSRYGGLKQMEGVGSAGETILDYTVFDAVRAGFEEAIFVIRPEMEDEFRRRVLGKFESRIRCRCVHQTLDSATGRFQVPPERVKPWGTGHAALVVRSVVQSPFVVVNADDYYGPDSLQRIHDRLEKCPEDPAMVAYVLRNTLSEHGTVARGICECDEAMRLRAVVETTAISKQGEAAAYTDENGLEHPLTGDELVSMNLWGFPVWFFRFLDEQFARFLNESGDQPRAEFFLPAVVNRLIEERGTEVNVLVSRDRWFGMTYRDDGARVRERLAQLVAAGVYPERLW